MTKPQALISESRVSDLHRQTDFLTYRKNIKSNERACLARPFFVFELCLRLFKMNERRGL